MKTKIIATTCAVAVILSTASAGAEWRQLTQNRIIVSGEIDNGQGKQPVTFNVLKPGAAAELTGEDFVFHGQTLTDENGKYEFIFFVPGESGRYTVNINENGENKTEYIEFKKDVGEGGSSGGSGSGGGNSSENPSSGITVLPPLSGNSEPEKLNEYIFDDLGEAEWASEAIVKLAEKGIVSGRTETEFCPNENMKREEFAKIVSDAFLGEITEEKDMEFKDVAEDSWYYSYVKKAYSAGAISGKSETLFGAGEFITREDMAVILYRILKDSFTKENLPHTFKDDEQISEYAREAVSVFYQNGIISGVGGDYFEPKANATRAQVAKIVSDLLELI